MQLIQGQPRHCSIKSYPFTAELHNSSLLCEQEMPPVLDLTELFPISPENLVNVQELVFVTFVQRHIVRRSAY